MTTESLFNTSGRPNFGILPALCPSVLTALVSSTAYLYDVQASLPATAGSAVTLTIQDRQSPTPVPALVVSMNPGDVLRWQFDGRTMSGGIAVIASSASAISLYARWIQ